MEEVTSNTRKDVASNTVVLIGRILLALIFLNAGLAKLGTWDGTAGYMASKGMPAIGLFLTLTVLIEVLGAASVITGLLARWGALLLALFLIPVTFVFHNFWDLAGMERQLQMSMFFKNLCIIGGLLVITGFGAGRYSLDALLARRRRERRPPGLTQTSEPTPEGI